VFFHEESIWMTSIVMSRMAQFMSEHCKNDWDQLVAIQPFIDWLVRKRVEFDGMIVCPEDVRATIHSLVVGDYLRKKGADEVEVTEKLIDHLCIRSFITKKPTPKGKVLKVIPTETVAICQVATRKNSWFWWW